MMRGVSSFSVGTIAGREPVAIECGAALDITDFTLLGENAETAGEFFDHPFFPGSQAGEIDLRGGEVDAPIFRLL
jgi:hypothetical protein